VVGGNRLALQRPARAVVALRACHRKQSDLAKHYDITTRSTQTNAPLAFHGRKMGLEEY
jgi:hypothetical protein